MIQNILVLIIIVFAIGYSVYAVVKNIRKKETTSCGGCNGCDIKREITKNIKPNSSNDPTTCGCSPK